MRGGWWGFVVLVVLFAVLVGPMVGLEARRTDIPAQKGTGYPSEVMDQDRYHWQVIQTMAKEWPTPNVVSYDSATTPGYHWVMAGMLRATGSRTALLLLNTLIGLALIASVWWSVAGVVGGWRGAALAAPVMLSPYVLGGSIWMTTDNAALMFVTLALGLAVLRRFTIGRAAGMGACATGGVLVRQIHLWPVAVIGLAGLLRSPLARFAPPALRDEKRQSPRSWKYFIAAAVAAAIPVVAVGVFVWLWGGLMPKSDWIRGFHDQGPNLASPAFALALAAAYGVFFLGLAWEQVRRIRVTDWALWAVAIAGLVVGAAAPTDYVRLLRQYGWLWAVVHRVGEPLEHTVPSLAALHRSPVIIVGAAAGAIVLLLLYRGARAAGNRTPALMLLLAMLGWLCAQTANTMAWQRYFDPMILIALAMLGALCVGREGKGCARWAWIGPIALGAGQLLLSVVTMYLEYLPRVL